MNSGEILNLIKAKELEIKKIQLEIDKLKKQYNELTTNSLEYSIYSDGEVAVTDNVLPGNQNAAICTLSSVASEPELGITKNGVQLPIFLVDAKTRSGQSGSPVFYHNNNGFRRNGNRLSLFGGPVSFNVGIYSGRINRDSDLGYVWKWSVIKEIIVLHIINNFNVNHQSNKKLES